MVWHPLTLLDMEAVADLFHASFGVMGQADVMKTSQVSRVNGTTHIGALLLECQRSARLNAFLSSSPSGRVTNMARVSSTHN